MKAFLLSLAIACLTLAGLAALSLEAGMRFDYAAASEAEQQEFLDHIADTMKATYDMKEGATELTRISADADADLIDLAVRFKAPEFEDPPAQQIEFLKRYMYTENCNYFATREIVEKGVRLDFSVLRPSGEPLALLAFDRGSCAPYLKANAHRRATGANR